ncbi:MAG TPA: hypothetical protein VM580_33690 [Labilithrix sp.]|nr:hypothetical protein [Labilithrix sp.]
MTRHDRGYSLVCIRDVNADELIEDVLRERHDRVQVEDLEALAGAPVADFAEDLSIVPVGRIFQIGQHRIEAGGDVCKRLLDRDVAILGNFTPRPLRTDLDDLVEVLPQESSCPRRHAVAFLDGSEAKLNADRVVTP